MFTCEAGALVTQELARLSAGVEVLVRRSCARVVVVLYTDRCADGRMAETLRAVTVTVRRVSDSISLTSCLWLLPKKRKRARDICVGGGLTVLACNEWGKTFTGTRGLYSLCNDPAEARA